MWSELKAQIKCFSVLAEVAKQMGEITGRVRIQKTLYLLKQRGLAELERIDFVYHYYGPFSSTAAESLADSVSEDVLREDRETVRFQEGNKVRMLYRYRPGDNVDEYALDVGDESRALIAGVLERLKDKHWRVLELAATVHFLEQDKGYDRESAYERAIALKPACEPYRAEARALLAELEL